MGQDFFIADIHFGDERIIRYENRPFASAEEMDNALIEKWNACVAAEDTVYVLGDFSVYGEDKNQKILTELKGRKILIMGNHDRHFTPQQWRQQGFAECSEWPVIYKDFFMLSHEPLYLNSNMPYANLFGHVHGNASYKDASTQSVCVSLERIGYQPMTFKDVISRIRAEK